MNVSRNMFFAAVAAAVICGGSVRASKGPTFPEIVKHNVQTSVGVVTIMTAAGVVVAENTQYRQVGEAIRDGGIYGGAHVLASEKPTMSGTLAAAGGGIVIAQGSAYVASTQTGQSVVKKMPDVVRNNGNWLKHCASVIGAHAFGSAVENKMAIGSFASK